VARAKPTRITQPPGAEFDPYRDWLGISGSQGPPHHYELLGLADFESDQRRIQAAFERRFQKIRRYEVGTKSEAAIAVLKRLSEAYTELTDATRKDAYDRALRQSSGRATVAAAANDTPPEEVITGSGMGRVEAAALAPPVLSSTRPVPPPRPKAVRSIAEGLEGSNIVSGEPMPPPLPVLQTGEPTAPPSPQEPPAAKEDRAALARAAPPLKLLPMPGLSDETSGSTAKPTAPSISTGEAAPEATSLARNSSHRDTAGWLTEPTRPWLPPSAARELRRQLRMGLMTLAALALLPLLSLAIVAVGAPLALLLAMVRFCWAFYLSCRIMATRGPGLVVRMLLGTLRMVDHALCSLAGSENRILLNFLRFWCILLAGVGAGWVGWWFWFWIAPALVW